MSVLDGGGIDELRALFDPAELAELLRRVRLQIEAALERMASAAHADDAQALSRAAHELGNSARMIGANELGVAASELDLDAAVFEPASDDERDARLSAVICAWQAVVPELEREERRAASN